MHIESDKLLDYNFFFFFMCFPTGRRAWLGAWRGLSNSLEHSGFWIKDGSELLLLSCI